MKLSMKLSMNLAVRPFMKLSMKLFVFVRSCTCGSRHTAEAVSADDEGASSQCVVGQPKVRRAEPHEYARLIESRALKQADAPGGLTPLKTAQLLKLPLCSIANLDVSGRVPIMGDLADSRSVIGRHGWCGTGGGAVGPRLTATVIRPKTPRRAMQAARSKL